MLKLTEKSKKELLNRHLGTGTIFIHTLDNEFESVNFFLGSKGEFYTEAACLKLESYFHQLAKELMQRIEMEQNEAIHQQMGVDGWQEIYADAPSEEDIREEMGEE